VETQRTGLSLMGDVGNRIARGIKAQFLVRLIGTPFQRLIDRSGKTHGWLTERALALLDADGYRDAAAFFRDHLDRLIKGNYWADSLWMNSTHHYNPKNKRGLWIWPGAADQIRNWFNLSSSFWAKNVEEKSVFVLGACIHIVQDCCQPYHSNCRVFGGHQEYERWADKHKEMFDVKSGGYYGLSDRPEGWAVANAEYSQRFLSAVEGPSSDARREATGLLIPRAIRTTAGFLVFFLEEMRGRAESRVEPVRHAVG
jgi:phospholipase C